MNNNIVTPTILAERIQKKTGINASIAKQFSIEFFKLAKQCLKEEDTFSIHRFGTFKKIWVEEGTGRNPQTNEEIIVPAHWRVKFIPARALALRVNAKYAHLKAKPINEKSWFAKEEKQPEFYKNADLNQIIEEENEDLEEENSPRKKNKLPLIIALLLLLLALILTCIKLLGGKKSAENPAQIKKEEPTPQVTEEPAPKQEPIVQPQEPEPQPVAQSTKYLVPSGSCYYKISQEQYKNSHLWPVIFAENIHINSDPDLIAANTSIFIPDSQIQTEQEQKCKDAYITTYNAYYNVIKEQPQNAKNPIRQFRAVRVLVSAEITFPGFIEENKSKFSEQDYNDALAIYRNYVP